jgi:hypothetical protein
MMGRTEQRLRDTATAIGETICLADLPELRLPEAGFRPARLRSRHWLLPVVAGACLLVLIVGLTVIGQTLGKEHTRSVGSFRAPTGALRYLVTAREAKGYVTSIATGKIIAPIPPPVPGYLIEGIAALPGDRVFYLAGEVYVNGTHGELQFFRVVLGPAGRPRPAQRVPGPAVRLPIPVSSDGLVSIPVAVSPDGRQLAYVTSNSLFANARARPATIVVRNLATGATRAWKLWPAKYTDITQVSWAGDGQLCVVGTIGGGAVAHGQVVRGKLADLKVIMVLRTSAAGHSLAADSRLLNYFSVPVYAYRPAVPPGVFMEGPMAAVATQDGSSIIAQIDSGPGARLVELSAATGKITKQLLTGSRAYQAQPSAVDGDQVLFTLSPRREHEKGSYVCGHLADANLRTAHITELPFPVYCSTNAPPEPFIASW